jgi:VanZ family protein
VISQVPDADKGIHFLLYGVEGFFLYGAVRWPGRRRLSLLRVLAVTGSLAVWATADEVHQNFIPGRQFSAADFVADTAGAAAGALLASAARSRRGARPEAGPPARYLLKNP